MGGEDTKRNREAPSASVSMNSSVSSLHSLPSSVLRTRYALSYLFLIKLIESSLYYTYFDEKNRLREFIFRVIQQLSNRSGI